MLLLALPKVDLSDVEQSRVVKLSYKYCIYSSLNSCISYLRLMTYEDDDERPFDFLKNIRNLQNL